MSATFSSPKERRKVTIVSPLSTPSPTGVLSPIEGAPPPKAKNSNRNLLSNLETIDDTEKGEGGVYSGSTVTSTFKRSQKVVADNSALMNSLMEGRKYIGEYHAQLQLDKIQLADLLESRTATLKSLTEKETRLDNQLEFMYEDCKRLSLDNEAIVAEGKRRDTELADLYAQLHLEESKFRSIRKNLISEQEKHLASSQAKWKQRSYLQKAKEKLVKQHETIWVMQDVVEYLEVEVAHLQKQLNAAEAKKLAPLLTQHELAQAAAAEVKAQRGTDACKRKDCVELRSQYAVWMERLQELIKEQRRQAAENRRQSLFGPQSSTGGGSSSTGVLGSVTDSALATPKHLAASKSGSSVIARSLGHPTPGRSATSLGLTPIGAAGVNIKSPTHLRLLTDSGRSPQVNTSFAAGSRGAKAQLRIKSLPPQALTPQPTAGGSLTGFSKPLPFSMVGGPGGSTRTNAGQLQPGDQNQRRSSLASNASLSFSSASVMAVSPAHHRAGEVKRRLPM